MRIVILILAGLAVIAAAEPIPSNGSRIVGGSVTTISQYPFGTPLQFSQNLVTFGQRCGGSIINNRSVLSAAHCFSNTVYYQWRIRVGSSYASSGGHLYNVALIINHPNYNPSTIDNDIAILRSATPIIFIPNAVQPVGIAGPNYIVPDNAVVWAIGWGLTSFGGTLSEQLRHVQIWTANQEICRVRYSEIGFTITDNMLCAGWLDVGGIGQCTNDSGGPLLHNNVVVGVTSFGVGCAHAHYPTVNARVSRYTAWIQANA